VIRTCRYIDHYRFPLSHFAQTVATRTVPSLGNYCTHTPANLTSTRHSEPTVDDECSRTGSVAGGTLGPFDSGLQSRARTWRTIDNWSHIDRLLGALARFHEGNTDGGFEIRSPHVVGACASTTSEATPKQLLEYIRLGTLGSIKERIKSSPESGEVTAERVPAECIRIKPRLLGRRSVLVVSGSLLVILQDLSSRVRAI